MGFCTAINCLDGRIQKPVIEYLQKRFNVRFVDNITDAGPNLVLAYQKNPAIVLSILRRLNISIEKHESVGVAIVGHHDCAGNPASKEDQLKHLKMSAHFLREQYGKIDIVGLWVDENWEVHDIPMDDKKQ